MTTALCLQCGKLKFGPLCPCIHCGLEPMGVAELNRAFSAENLTVPTLERFGRIIRRINKATHDKNLRYWTFLEHVSRTTNLLTIEIPDGAADRVEQLLFKLELPLVDVTHVSPHAAEEANATCLELPASALAAYLAEYPFYLLTKIDLKLRDGRVRRACFLMHAEERYRLLLLGESDIGLQDIAAIRHRLGGPIGWFLKSPWVRLQAE